MKIVAETVEIIRTALQSGRLNSQAEAAAAEYAKLCQEAVRRLDAVAVMLSKGSDYQALQLAEQEPPLLELVASLSFGGEKTWQELCEANQWLVAPKLDAKTVQALDALYVKGISANHPLYKDFRAAVLSRDDDKALRIIRTILKLNPADENAKSELQRLDNKQFQNSLEQLRAALKTDDEERIATLAEDVAARAPAEKLARLDDYQQAAAIGRALRRRQTEDRLPALISQLADLQAQGDWQTATPQLAAVHELMRRHGAELQPGVEKDQLEAVTRFVQRERLAADKKRDFDLALRGFMVFVEEIETRLLTGAGVTYSEITEKDEAFVRRWKELEGYQLPAPNETLQRLRTAGQELRAKLTRMERARRVRMVSAAAAVIAVLLGIAAIAFHAWQAHTFAENLAGYQARAVCVPAEDLSRDIRANQPLMLHWPFLKTKLEEVEGWTRQARMLSTQADQSLQPLEAAAKSGFADMDPTHLAGALKDAGRVVGQLASDLAQEPSNRLAALQTQSDLHIGGLLKGRVEDATSKVAALEKTSTEELSFEHLAESASASATGIEAALARLEKWLTPEVENLQLPADVVARIKALRQRLDGFNTKLQHFEQIRERTAASTTLADYTKSLADWQDVPFAEAAKAATALNVLPVEDTFLAKLLTGGDLAVLKAIQEDASGRYMSPDAPTDDDLKHLLALRDDSNLNGVWLNKVMDHRRKGERSVWSRGPLSESSIGGDARRWSGMCYDPEIYPTGVSFVQVEYRRASIAGNFQGENVLAQKLSTTSEMLESLQLNRMHDDNGEHFRRPVLEVFDKIVQNQSASALAKAYVMLQLADMAQPRAYAWGLHLSPTLGKDLNELRKLLPGVILRSDDWMLPKMRDIEASLGKFFAGCSHRTYLKEAWAQRDFLLSVTQAGLRFGGYVEVDLSLRLNATGRGSKELWVLPAEGTQPLSVANKLAQKAATDGMVRLVGEGALPLSPIFFIPVDRKQLLARYQEALAGTEAAPVVQSTSEILFMTPP